ncbi:MAG: hypothetical protein ABSG04_09405 [Verrucomicrobiota bacterium]|jgi:hypothetical protein
MLIRQDTRFPAGQTILEFLQTKVRADFTFLELLCLGQCLGIIEPSGILKHCFASTADRKKGYAPALFDFRFQKWSLKICRPSFKQYRHNAAGPFRPRAAVAAEEGEQLRRILGRSLAQPAFQN